MRTVTLFLTMSLLAAGLLLTGCSSAPKAEEKAASKEAMKQYQLKGEIMGLDASQRVVTVKHGAIEGFMGAMTMGYPVKDPAEFSKIAMGDQITATVYVSGDDMYLGNFQKAPPQAKDATTTDKK